MDQINKFHEFRKKYPEFIYHSYQYQLRDDLEIEYHFEIPGLCFFTPKLILKKNYIRINPDKEILEYLIFQIGLIEIISYVKCTCSKKIIIKADYINPDQIKFLKKLYYNGLGEFLYTNGITVEEKELFELVCEKEEKKLQKSCFKSTE